MFDDLTLHELKNPLSGINTAVDMLLAGMLGELGEEQKKYLENIDCGARRLTALLLELTYIDQIEQRQYQPAKATCPLNELTRDLAWLKQLAERENKAVAEVIDAKLTLRGDCELTRLAVAALLQSALKRTPRGGTASLNIRPEAGRAVIETSDPGDSIPPELLSRVFERDSRHQVKARIGSPIDLYFCKLAAEAQGGELAITNGPEQGARFSFYLPAA
ncbi:MAG: HAMP domain-containing histidine kinase [Candidatus Saganbacteria bacterium]|nr:HAMP domain-containing histidine kinase [Candidatus Saganbacteria bacterium]